MVTEHHIRLHAIVSGRVQGVGFRASAQHRAAQLKLTGWVRNMRNGDVETVAEGPRQALEKFVTWLHRGPVSAYVRKVEPTWEDATGEFDTFRISYRF